MPTDAEWNKMTKYLDASVDTTCNGCWSGTTVGGQLKSTTLWNSPNTGATNSSGFSGLPGGYRSTTLGSFYSVEGEALWWSASEYFSTYNRAKCVSLSYNNSGAYRTDRDKRFSISVRVVKD